MSRWVAINYREFWDVPRIFFAEDEGQLYLFDCPFDEETEDYPRDYQVYQMPELTETELSGSWENLERRAVRHLGQVPINRVDFDPTKRRQIDASILDAMIARTPG